MPVHTYLSVTRCRDSAQVSAAERNFVSFFQQYISYCSWGVRNCRFAAGSSYVVADELFEQCAVLRFQSSRPWNRFERINYNMVQEDVEHSFLPVTWSACTCVFITYISLRLRSFTSWKSLQWISFMQQVIDIRLQTNAIAVHLSAVSNAGSIKMASLEALSTKRYVYVDDSFSNNCLTIIGLCEVDIACAFITTWERMKGSLLLNDTALLNIKNKRKRKRLLMHDRLIMKAATQLHSFASQTHRQRVRDDEVSCWFRNAYAARVGSWTINLICHFLIVSNRIVFVVICCCND